MSLFVSDGDLLQCDCGSARSQLSCGPATGLVDDCYMATIADHVPGKNIAPFGHCSKLNGACNPATNSRWSCRNSVFMDDIQVLTDDGTTTCDTGGTISVAVVGQTFASGSDDGYGASPAAAATGVEPFGIRIITPDMVDAPVAGVDQPAAAAIQMNPNNMYWPPYNPLAEEGKRHIEIEYTTDVTRIAVLSPEEAHEFLQNLYEDIGGKDSVGDIKDYGGLADGVKSAYTTAIGLGGLGVKATTRTINGREWVVIQNFSRHRQTLMRGAIWRANNPRIIELGLGLNNLKGVVRFVKFNTLVEITVSVGINAVEYILRDEATLAEFVGESAGDIVKGLVALGFASGAAVMASTVGSPVIGTLTIFAGVSFVISQSKILDDIDDKYELSEGLVKAIEGLFDE